MCVCVSFIGEYIAMNISMLKKARMLWNVEYVTREQNRHNQLQWVRSVKALGDKWLLAQHVQKRG